MVEKISAVTLRVANMRASVRFYEDVLGLEIIYAGEGSYFTSLRTKGGDTILNLEHGNAGIRWGRLILLFRYRYNAVDGREFECVFETYEHLDILLTFSFSVIRESPR